MEKLVLKYTTGEFVAIDNGSGGYPYKVKDVFRAQFWNSEDDALSYIRDFDHIERKVYRVTASITPINS